MNSDFWQFVGMRSSWNKKLLTISFYSPLKITIIFDPVKKRQMKGNRNVISSVLDIVFSLNLKSFNAYLV
jgi:hypothetical protein